MNSSVERVIEISRYGKDTFAIWIFRAGDSHFAFGDPFDFSCVLLKEADTVEVKGAAGSGVSMRILKLVKSSARSMGAKKLYWKRDTGKEIKIDL